jgi:hypothetical protein
MFCGLRPPGDPVAAGWGRRVGETADPTQLGGYDYAGNDPVTQSDPSGQNIAGESEYGTANDSACDLSCANKLANAVTHAWNEGVAAQKSRDTGWGWISGAGHAVENFFAGGNKKKANDWFGGLNDIVHGWIAGNHVDQSSDAYQTSYFTGYWAANLAPTAIDPAVMRCRSGASRSGRVRTTLWLSHPARFPPLWGVRRP